MAGSFCVLGHLGISAWNPIGDFGLAAAIHCIAITIILFHKTVSYPLIDWLCMAELTKEQIACEEKFLEGIPRWNIGALFLPPVWGPAHGFWATILFYPLWLVADNLFYAAYSERTPLAIAFAAIIGVVLVAVTFLFSRLSQPFAAHRAVARGVSKETYVRRERIWAVVCVVVGLAMIGFATWYNLMIRPGMEG